MGQVLPFLATPPSGSSPRQPKNQNDSRRVLIVESDTVLQKYFKERLQRGEYTVRIATTAQQGFQLFQDFGPFNVVVIDYFIPETEHDRIDPLAAFQTHSVELASAIRDARPAQEIVMMARDYCSPTEVPLPPNMHHVRVLAGHDELHQLLERIEIERAFESLTDTDWIRLKNFANYRIRGLGPMARDRDGQDLLSEAVYRTLLGTRHWKTNIDFVHHLRETMRSIADQWKRRLKASPFGENTSTDSEGEEHSLIDDAVSVHVSIESRLSEESELNRVINLFKDDSDSECLLRGVAGGLRKSDLMSRYGLDEKRYAAALRRIRQMLRTHAKGGN